MAENNRLIALIDGSAYAESVLDHAAFVAGKTGFGIDLLHVIDRRGAGGAPLNLAGNLTLGARSELLQKLSDHDEQSARMARERGRLVLDAAEAYLKDKVEDVRVRLRLGDLLDAVGEVEDEARLLIIGKRGEDAGSAKQHLGSNLERVVRAAHRPVLVASRAFKPVEKAILAFDDGESVAKAVDHIAQGRFFRDIALKLLHVGEDRAGLRKALDAAVARLAEAGLKAEGEIVSGQPAAVLSQRVDSGQADMLVMGAYGHSPVRNLIIGSTTTEIVRSCHAPVMLFR